MRFLRFAVILLLSLISFSAYLVGWIALLPTLHSWIGDVGATVVVFSITPAIFGGVIVCVGSYFIQR